MANSDPTRLTDAEKTKAFRAQWILWLVAAALVIVPLVVYWVLHLKKG